MRLNVEIKAPIYAELAAHAEAAGRSLSDVVRALINQWNREQRGGGPAREQDGDAIRDDGRACEDLRQDRGSFR